jgi:SAM-dependent methyltransferase
MGSTSGRWYDGRVYGTIVDRLLAGVHDSVAAHLPGGQRVLDAACGTGALSRRIAGTGRTVVGVDLSARHIEYARERAEREGFSPEELRFEVTDLRELAPPPEGRFDVAVIVLALHEMPAEVRPVVVDRLAGAAEQVVIVDFAAPLALNAAGVTKRAAELAAGREHHAAFRDYERAGGLDTILERGEVAVVGDRTIDSGTLRVVTVVGRTG